MKTVQQIMQETGAKANIRNFRYMQENYTYKQKIRHAENVARSYQDKCSEMGLNCHVSVGGLDSITLHYFLEMCGVHVPCVSCSSLEQKGVQAVHKQIAAEMENTYSAREWLGAHMALPQDEIDTITDPDTRAQEQALHDACPPVPRMYFLKPLKPKTKVIEELGWPVLSKEIAGKISLLQNPTPKNATVRHAIITGETGEYGGFQKNSRMKLSQRWLEKFGGADAEGAALGYEAAPFKVSERCCYYLKEKPCDDWAKEHNSVPYLGLMASEGGRREKSLIYCGGYDAWSASYWVDEMQDTFGKGVFVPVQQTMKTLSLPMKQLGADFDSKLIIYNNNPVLKWCLANTGIVEDKNGNIKPNKTSKARKRIDGLAALLDAFVVFQDRQDDYKTMI